MFNIYLKSVLLYGAKNIANKPDHAENDPYINPCL